MDFYKVPLGFGMALAMNANAMNAYSGMTEMQKQAIPATRETLELRVQRAQSPHRHASSERRKSNSEIPLKKRNSSA